MIKKRLHCRIIRTLFLSRYRKGGIRLTINRPLRNVILFNIASPLIDFDQIWLNCNFRVFFIFLTINERHLFLHTRMEAGIKGNYY